MPTFVGMTMVATSTAIAHENGSSPAQGIGS
jgi:hypothetical protein